MSELKMSKPAGEKEFEAHPEGTFMAVCRDIYMKKDVNPYFGKVSKFNGKVDERATMRRIYFEFLTDEPIEIGGKMVPRFVRYRANVSWHEDSNLRKFIRGWSPTLGKDDEADLQALVGKGAYLTIAHNVGTDGKTYANVVGAAAPPKGATVPMVPSEFVRNKDRDGAAPSAEPQHAQGEDESDLPF